MPPSEFEMSLAADLHVHTINSDGTFTLSEIPAAARDAGLDVVAITDHDRLHPDLSGPVAIQDGITIIHGIELRVETDIGERVDLLGYGAHPTDALEDEVTRLQADRADRAQRMIDRVEEHLEITLSIEGEAGMGRPDVARAIDTHDGTEHDYESAFKQIIGHGCPCYVSRTIPSFEEGVSILSDACAIVGLAHPFRYDNPADALELTADLDAVECFYPYGGSTAVDTEQLDHAVETYDLLQTGGTDAHETTLGKAGLTDEQYEPFQKRLFTPR